MPQKLISQLENSTLLTDFSKNRFSKSHGESEQELEEELIQTLVDMGYEYRKDINREEELLENLRVQMERLNSQRIKDFKFSDREWNEFLNSQLKDPKSSGIEGKTEKIQGDGYKFELKRDDGRYENIILINKTNPDDNFLQVINQYRDEEGRKRYDVTILVNGLPLIQIELKKRGVALKEAFFQIDNYKNTSYSSSYKLFEFIQIFIISNGTNTKYYSNTTYKSKQEKKKVNDSFLFTSYWSDVKNERIEDIVDFSKTFLYPKVIKKIITKYCVFDTQKRLKILRPYQIAAIEKIKEKIQLSINHNLTENSAGGYIWHTTGSGKTLTSFKAAQLALEIKEVKRVIFVVDRKDLDDQTCLEYEKYEPGSVDRIRKTSYLEKKLLENEKNKKIIVTTIQRLSRLLGDKGSLKNHTFQERTVIIMDECHRSQSGEMHRRIVNKFKKVNVFGFTGTPILKSKDTDMNTDAIFGNELHSYKICSAIQDENVLPFNYEFVGDRRYVGIKDEKALRERKKYSVEWILNNFHKKTIHGNFNGLLATDSIDSAIQYHKLFEEQQQNRDKKLKVAIIYSSGSDNQKKGQVVDDSYEIDPLEIDDLSESSRQYLEKSAQKFAEMFDSQVDIDGGLQNYHSHISKKMKERKIDLLIVVNMFLTGFDAPTLNTIWIDKNLKEHGLIQTISRTNRIYDASKIYGNIVSFEDIEENLEFAIKKFATNGRIVMSPGFNECYEEYLHVWKDKLVKRFPLDRIETLTETQDDEVEFCKSFSKFIQLDNTLQHYSAFYRNERMDVSDAEKYQDVYLKIKEKISKMRERYEREGMYVPSSKYDEITFEMEILSSKIINVDTILKLIATIKNQEDAEDVMHEKENLLRIIKADLSWRIIYDLFENYLNNRVYEKQDWIDYMREQKAKETDQIILEEKLNTEIAKKFVEDIFKSEDDFICWKGTKLREMMPPMGFRSTKREEQARRRRTVQEKIKLLFDRFRKRGI